MAFKKSTGCSNIRKLRNLGKVCIRYELDYHARISRVLIESSFDVNTNK